MVMCNGNGFRFSLMRIKLTILYEEHQEVVDARCPSLYANTTLRQSSNDFKRTFSFAGLNGSSLNTESDSRIHTLPFVPTLPFERAYDNSSVDFYSTNVDPPCPMSIDKRNNSLKTLQLHLNLVGIKKEDLDLTKELQLVNKSNCRLIAGSCSLLSTLTALNLEDERLAIYSTNKLNEFTIVGMVNGGDVNLAGVDMEHIIDSLLWTYSSSTYRKPKILSATVDEATVSSTFGEAHTPRLTRQTDDEDKIRTEVPKYKRIAFRVKEYFKNLGFLLGNVLKDILLESLELVIDLLDVFEIKSEFLASMKGAAEETLWIVFLQVNLIITGIVWIKVLITYYNQKRDIERKGKLIRSLDDQIRKVPFEKSALRSEIADEFKKYLSPFQKLRDENMNLKRVLNQGFVLGIEMLTRIKYDMRKYFMILQLQNGQDHPILTDMLIYWQTRVRALEISYGSQLGDTFKQINVVAMQGHKRPENDANT